MVKLNFRITDDIQDYKAVDFMKEWISIYGGVELIVNHQAVGYCPQRELFPGEEWTEDIWYALYKLSEGAICTYDGQEYEIQLLSSNLLTLRMKLEVDLIISCIHEQGNRVLWCERVEYIEFSTEIKRALDEFLESISQGNKNLLKAKPIQEMRERKRELERILEGI
ncbi:MAG: hypothetical protein E7290_06270 [Lachnospiraceae bacterium]|nr:hypothetical protein [Lachnospiraceae bacterium]